MANNCPPAPINKKEYITQVGTILVNDFGKKKFYSPEEVKHASRKAKHSNNRELDWHCWAMSIFSSHTDFDAYHKITGEICDYALMKTNMLNGLTTGSLNNVLELSSDEIDASLLDLGDLFDGFLEGVGDIIGGIFDSI